MLVMTTEGLQPIWCYCIEPRSLRVIYKTSGSEISVRGNKQYEIEEGDLLVRPLQFMDPAKAIAKSMELRKEVGLCEEGDPSDEEDIYDFSFVVRLAFNDILSVAGHAVSQFSQKLVFMDYFSHMLSGADPSLEIPDIPELTESLGSAMSSLSRFLDLTNPDSTVFKSRMKPNGLYPQARRYIDPMGNLPQVSPDSKGDMIVVRTGLHKASVPFEIWRRGDEKVWSWWHDLPWLEQRRRCIEDRGIGEVDPGELQGLETWFNRLDTDTRIEILRRAHEREVSRAQFADMEAVS